MKNRIITISREFGSGGRTVGRMTAKELGIPCYDSELTEKIAAESGFSEEYVREIEENSKGRFLSVFSSRAYSLNNEDIVWKVQCKVISELAQKGPCVIVGRCADYVLRDEADCLKVFIHADMRYRAERIVKVYGETRIPAEQRLKEKDKRRAAYHRFYTDRKWGETKNYDITLDSGRLGTEKCVEILKLIY